MFVYKKVMDIWYNNTNTVSKENDRYLFVRRWTMESQQQGHFEQLGDGVFVFVSDEHRFGTDAFLLSDFAAPRRKDTVCDFGTGCGIIPLYLYKEYSPKHCIGVEIQPEGARQFEKGIEASGAGERLSALCADLSNAPELLQKGTFDLVTCNPPYKAAGAGIKSAGDAQRIARHEIFCTIEDVCRSAAALLRFGGRLCLCQRPERLADVIVAMRANGVEPKRLRFVSKNPQGRPWLVLVEGKKGSKPFLQMEPPLFLEEGGRYFGLKKELSGGQNG